MFRLLGFLTGSAVSVITILLIIGIPEFHFSNPQLDKRRFDEAVEKLKEKKQEVEIVAEQMIEELTETGTATPLTISDVQQDVFLEAPVPPPNPDPQWHPIWNPFRSKIAADGFVKQLEKVTGLDYRVVKVDTGVYQVAFSYADDSQRQIFLSQISAATGLEFSGL
jgi:hypothetical protein